MASGGSAIRGSRVGAGPMGEQDRGFHAERVAVSLLGCPRQRDCAVLRGQPPRRGDPGHHRLPQLGTARRAATRTTRRQLAKLEPYKTHLAYVKERRTEEEAATLLDEALSSSGASRRCTAADRGDSKAAERSPDAWHLVVAAVPVSTRGR